MYLSIFLYNYILYILCYLSTQLCKHLCIYIFTKTLHIYNIGQAELTQWLIFLLGQLALS